MGFKVKPGAGEEARRELNAFVMAYPVNQIGNLDGVLLYWTPDPTDGTMFQTMELNHFLGEFNAVEYVMNL